MFYKYITKLDSKSQKIPKARGSQVRSAVWRKTLSFQKTTLIKHSMFFFVSTKSLEYTALGDFAEKRSLSLKEHKLQGPENSCY